MSAEKQCFLDEWGTLPFGGLILSSTGGPGVEPPSSDSYYNKKSKMKERKVDFISQAIGKNFPIFTNNFPELCHNLYI